MGRGGVSSLSSAIRVLLWLAHRFERRCGRITCRLYLACWFRLMNILLRSTRRRQSPPPCASDCFCRDQGALIATQATEHGNAAPDALARMHEHVDFGRHDDVHARTELHQAD